VADPAQFKQDESHKWQVPSAVFANWPVPQSVTHRVPDRKVFNWQEVQMVAERLQAAQGAVQGWHELGVVVVDHQYPTAHWVIH